MNIDEIDSKGMEVEPVFSGTKKRKITVPVEMNLHKESPVQSTGTHPLPYEDLIGDVPLTNFNPYVDHKMVSVFVHQSLHEYYVPHVKNGLGEWVPASISCTVGLETARKVQRTRTKCHVQYCRSDVMLDYSTRTNHYNTSCCPLPNHEIEDAVGFFCPHHYRKYKYDTKQELKCDGCAGRKVLSYKKKTKIYCQECYFKIRDKSLCEDCGSTRYVECVWCKEKQCSECTDMDDNSYIKTTLDGAEYTEKVYYHDECNQIVKTMIFSPGQFHNEIVLHVSAEFMVRKAELENKKSDEVLSSLGMASM